MNTTCLDSGADKVHRPIGLALSNKGIILSADINVGFVTAFSKIKSMKASETDLPKQLSHI